MQKISRSTFTRMMRLRGFTTANRKKLGVKIYPCSCNKNGCKGWMLNTSHDKLPAQSLIGVLSHQWPAKSLLVTTI